MKIRPAEALLYRLLKLAEGQDRRKRALTYLDAGAVRNILVVSSTAIGDTLMSTPALRAVRAAFPGARITALLNKDNMELFRNNAAIDEALPFHGGWKRFVSTVLALRRRRPDVAVILHGNEPQATPLCYLAGARFIVKLPNVSRFAFLLSNREPALTWADLGHGIEARLRTAALIGAEPCGLEMDLEIDRVSSEAVEALLRREGVTQKNILIGFNPGASTLSRQWFPESFIELGRTILSENPGARIILTGSPAEAALCREIARGLGVKGRAEKKGPARAGKEKAGESGVIVTAGRLSLRESAALMARLDVFVTGDTGPMHMAYALKTPVVALYAVSEPERTGPLQDRDLHRIIKKPRTCDPCVSKKCTYQECMEQISAAEVYAAVRDILGAGGGTEKMKPRGKRTGTARRRARQGRA